MSPDQFEEAHQRARKVARWYAKVSGGDVGDLESEALAAQLNAERTFDETKGAWPQYAMASAMRAARNYLRLRYSVSGRLHASHEALRATEAIQFLEEEHSGDGVEDELRVREIRENLVRVLGKSATDFALGVMTGEFRPRDVAADHGIAVERVYSVEKTIRRKVRRDPVLRTLWSEL